MIGSMIGAGLSAVGSIFGGMSASKAMKNVKNSIKEQRRENEDWYNRRYNEDATQLADAQAMISKTEEGIKARNKEAAGAQAVMGGTEESVAATKAANAQAMADATAQIAVAGARRKDGIERQAQAKDDALQSELNDLERQKAGQIAQATQGVVQTGAKIAELF